MKFCCTSNAAIKNFKMTTKISTFFKNYFQYNHNFPQKYRFCSNIKYIFRRLEVLPVILTTYLPVYMHTIKLHIQMIVHNTNNMQKYKNKNINIMIRTKIYTDTSKWH